MQISHIDYVAANTCKLVAAGVLNENDIQIQLMMAGATNLRTRTIEKKLSGTGVTVAELMLAEGIDTEWYKEASVAYFGQNLKTIREELKCAPKDLARICGISVQSIRNYEAGNVPTLRRMQCIADVLEVEVADLLLPPEGSEQSEAD